jgi:hypothetical protein
MTPTARTLKLLRAEGYTTAVVERWNAHARIRQDLFGWADVCAFHPRLRLIVLVQTTTADHLAARIAKAKALPSLLAWLEAGGRAEFQGWQKRGPAWECKRVRVGVDDVDRSSIIPRAKARTKVRGLFE